MENLLELLQYEKLIPTMFLTAVFLQ